MDGAAHQGVVLEADPLPVCRAEEWAAGAFADDAIVLVLDGVEDPHNFGAIVRSAAACGARAVLFGKDRAAPISPVAVKSAAGAMEYVELVRATNVARALELLKGAGFWCAALAADAPQVLWEVDLTGRIALVVGSEGKGIRRLVRERCDMSLRIPITGAITSLNASVSAAVALAECLRQRR
jgi:23S rRNA (guanosine2251-2'-O)-methyltransferase